MSGTVFLDIDGTILENLNGGISRQLDARVAPEALPGVKKLFDKLHDEGHFIVLITARPMSHKQMTERELLHRGLFWDMLIMGAPKGPRVVVNDSSERHDLVAAGVEHARNSEWRDVDIDALLTLLSGRRIDI